MPSWLPAALNSEQKAETDLTGLLFWRLIVISLTISIKLKPAASLCTATQTDGLGNSEGFCERAVEELLIRAGFPVLISAHVSRVWPSPHLKL